IPSSVQTVRDFDSFILDSWPDVENGGSVQNSKLSYLNDRRQAEASGTGRRRRNEPGNGPMPDLRVEYDGPARDYNSNNIYPYSRNDVFSVPERYSQLLQWYFGGRHYPITKAIRIVLDDQGNDKRSLFIGYQGPGGH